MKRANCMALDWKTSNTALANLLSTILHEWYKDGVSRSSDDTSGCTNGCARAGEVWVQDPVVQHSCGDHSYKCTDMCSVCHKTSTKVIAIASVMKVRSTLLSLFVEEQTRSSTSSSCFEMGCGSKPQLNTVVSMTEDQRS